ncbi:Hypothetical predicted protein [Xyrichtys novacula]|uniref:Uncharacterized protein n=1 Tax=Xyrichtys novacula TaxID=13765 RepID=A0AAV1HBC5_XYRNO|nr:Hypothetical predicted protein [Xyrichtys novacula]
MARLFRSFIGAGSPPEGGRKRERERERVRRVLGCSSKRLLERLSRGLSEGLIRLRLWSDWVYSLSVRGRGGRNEVRENPNHRAKSSPAARGRRRWRRWRKKGGDGDDENGHKSVGGHFLDTWVNLEERGAEA